MESPETPRVRYQLVLGKFPIEEITPVGDMYRVVLRMPNSIHTHFFCPFKPDLNPGDLLTLYTEVQSATPQKDN